jgi:hypothetical protein
VWGGWVQPRWTGSSLRANLRDNGDDPRGPSSLPGCGFGSGQDLQALLFAKIDVIGADLKVIAQEYGKWEDAHRRLDLLAIDRDGHMVRTSATAFV